MTARLDTFLRIAADHRASDLHLHAGKSPVLRYQGDLVRLPYRTLAPFDVESLLGEVLSDAQQDTLHRARELELVYEVAGAGRFRGSISTQLDGLSAVFRVIPSRVPTVDELRIPRVVRDLALAPNGIVLITGPTGSGKSTTLAALVDFVNRTRSLHIVCVEDPIEYSHTSDRSVVTQREVGRDAVSFAAALRSALRQAPDILLVGEVRDFETVQILLSAADAGVLVLATLHTGSASKAVDRLIGACPEEEQEHARASLALGLRGVVSQRLCRHRNGVDRIAAMEILLPSHAVSHLIRENKLHQIDSYLRSGERLTAGATTLEHALADLVTGGEVEADEALRACNDEAFLRDLLARRGGEA